MCKRREAVLFLRDQSTWDRIPLAIHSLSMEPPFRLWAVGSACSVRSSTNAADCDCRANGFASISDELLQTTEAGIYLAVKSARSVAITNIAEYSASNWAAKTVKSSFLFLCLDSYREGASSWRANRERTQTLGWAQNRLH